MPSNLKSVTFLRPYGAYNANEPVFLPSKEADRLVLDGVAKLTNSEDTVAEEPLPDPLEMLKKYEAKGSIEDLDTDVLRKLAKDLGIKYTAQKGHDTLVEDLIDAGYTADAPEQSEDNSD